MIENLSTYIEIGPKMDQDVCIAGLGIYEGPKVKEQEWIDSVRPVYGPILDKVSKNPGIEWRQLHENGDLDGIEAKNDRAKELMLQMCLQACTKAIEDAGIEAKEITHIVWVSSTWIGAPAMDLQISTALGLDPGVIRTPIMMAGCSGGGIGLQMAYHIVKGDSKAICLLVASDVASTWLKANGYGDPNLAIANTIFSDGAGAIVLGSISRTNLRHPKDGNSLAMISTPISYLVPNTLDHMAIKVRNDGLYPRLSPTIHLETSKSIPYILDRLQVQEPTQYLVHPGGKSILMAIGHRDRMDASWHILENYGNMSSASIFYVMAQVWRRPGIYPIITFGQGLHIAAIKMSISSMD